jgi:hypothetical protein
MVIVFLPEATSGVKYSKKVMLVGAMIFDIVFDIVFAIVIALIALLELSYSLAHSPGLWEK